MGYVNKELIDAANAGGRFIKMEVGDKIRGTYKGYQEKMSEKYNKKSFHFKILLDGENEPKDLSTSSVKTIRQFAYIKEGTFIEIMKLGEGKDTSYKITELENDDYNKKSKKSKKKKKKKKTSLSDL